jgi:hypothetical protein
MKTPALLLALLLASTVAHAAKLEPHQDAALKRILSTVPADQQAAVRPRLEGMLAGLNKEQTAMMVAKMDAKAAAAPAGRNVPTRAAARADRDLTDAEAEKIYANAKDYIARVSDQRDAIKKTWEKVLNDLRTEWSNARTNSLLDQTALDVCNNELNLVPTGRRIPGMQEPLGEQDKLMLKVMGEARMRYGTVENYAAAVGQPVSSPMVQPQRFYFAPAIGEAEAKAKLQQVERELAALLESSAREAHKIWSTGYGDQGAGISSKLQARDMAALRERTTKAATGVCTQGLEAYHRGLDAFIDQVVGKAR